MKTKKFLLPETEIPTHWYNVVADMDSKPQRMRNPQTNEPMQAEDLYPLFAEELPARSSTKPTLGLKFPRKFATSTKYIVLRHW